MVRLARGLGRLLALALPLITPHIASAETVFTASAVNDVVYAQDYCTGGSGTFTSPWTSGSGTGCMQEALQACFLRTSPNPNPPPTDPTAGCKIVMPKGYVKVTQTIDTSYTIDAGNVHHFPKYGLVVEGHGPAIMYADGSGAFAGTTLIWNGSAGGTVLKIYRNSFSVFENFSIIGGVCGSAFESCTTSPSTKAGIGIDLTTDSESAIEKDIVRNVHIENIAGIGIRVGVDDANRSTSPEVDSMTLDAITVRRATVGAEQNGGQTTNVHWKNCAFEEFTDAGMDFLGADAHVQGCSFISTKSPVDSTKRADVRVHSTDSSGTKWKTLWAMFQDNVHETYYGSAYLFCDDTLCGSAIPEVGASRFEPTTLLNSRVYWWGASTGKVVDYRHGGALNLIGCTFDLAGSHATDTPTVAVDVPNVTYPVDRSTTVTSLGNYWVQRSEGGSIKLALTGDATLLSNDNALQVATALNSKVTSIYRDNGMLFDEGSFNWKKTGASSPIVFKQYLDASSKLTLTDGSGNAVASWSDTSELKFQKSTGKLSFQSTSIVAASPGTSATVSVPAITGTAVVSNSSAAQMICSNATVDPGSITNASTGTTTFTATGVATGDSCTCTPRSDWGNQVVQKYCIAGSGNLTLHLYSAKTSGQALDPGSTTVDYCCVRK